MSMRQKMKKALAMAIERKAANDARSVAMEKAANDRKVEEARRRYKLEEARREEREEQGLCPSCCSNRPGWHSYLNCPEF